MANKDLPLSEIMIKDVVMQSEDVSIEEAALIMTHTTIGAVVVVDSNHKPVGIFTERDLVTKVIGRKTPKYTQLKAVMSTQMVTMLETQSVVEAAIIMDRKKIRHIIIVNEKGSLTGIVSIRDTSKALVAIIQS